jgi:O-antigen ligase
LNQLLGPNINHPAKLASIMTIDKITHSFAHIILGLWLFSVIAAGLLTRVYFQGYSNSSSALGISVLWPLLYFAFSRCSFIPRAPDIDRLIAIYVFVIFGGFSVCISEDVWLSLSYFLMTLLVFFIALQFNTNLTVEQFERGLKLYSVLSTMLLVLYAIWGLKTGVRLGDEVKSFGSNAVAVMTVSSILSAMAIRTIIIRLLVMVPGIAVLYLTGSRTSAVFMLIALFIIFWKQTKVLSLWNKLVVIGIVSLLLGCGVIYSEFIVHHGEKFFAIHDKFRGIGTGATGRSYAWRETWGLFRSSPIIGVGFRAHEKLIKIASSSHNGYLALLAEIGMFGFAGAVYMITRGIVILWNNSKEHNYVYMYSIMFGLCVGYLFLGIFERYLFNIGNPTSLMFVLGIMSYKLESEGNTQTNGNNIYSNMPCQTRI